MAQEKDFVANRTVRVALFEDSVAARAIWEKLVFSGHAVEVITLEDPLFPEAKRKELAEFNPEILVVDLVMGTSRFDGYNLLKEISADQRFQGLPVVVCSKLISSSLAGQEVMNAVREIKGVKAVFPKLPDYPSYDDIISVLNLPPDRQER